MNATAHSAGSAEKTIKIVGFGWRLVAALIDGLLLGALSFLFGFIILSSGLPKSTGREGFTQLKDYLRCLILSYRLPIMLYSW